MDIGSFVVQITSRIVVLSCRILDILVSVVIGIVKALLPSNILPQKSFKDEVVLITGSGSGLGRQLAIRFARRKAKLILWDLNEDTNTETKNLIMNEEGAEAHCFTIDLSDRNGIYETASKSIDLYGCIDIVINNAGIVSGKKLFDCSDEMMEKTLRVNTHSLFYLTKAVLPGMIERDKGHIVTIASMAGKIGIKGMLDYCASKFGAVGFMESLWAELRSRSKNLHVTLVCPYYMNTGMFDGVESVSPTVLPILSVDYVADRTMEAIATNTTFLWLPRFCYFGMILKELLPSDCAVKIANLLGIDQGLDGFYAKRA